MLQKAAFLLLIFVALQPVRDRSLYAQTPVVTLATTFPAGGKIGSVNKVETLGSHLDEVDRLYFSHPGIRAKVETLPAVISEWSGLPHYGHFEVEISKDVPTGIYEVWAQGRLGVSNPRPFLVTANDHIRASDHAAQERSIELTPNVWVHSQFAAKQRNYYRVRGEAGATIRIVCLAGCLDSRAIPQIMLRDPSGKIVAKSREVGRNIVEIHHSVQTPGEYGLVLQEFLFRGGPEYSYSLVQSSEGVPEELQQWDGVRVPASLGFDAVRHSGIPLLTHTGSQSGQPTAVNIPVLIASRWDSSADRHAFDVDLKAGDKVECVVYSDSLRAETDPRLVIEKVHADGKTPERLLVQDDSPSVGGPVSQLGSRDPRVQFVSPNEGRFRFSVTNLQSDSNAREKKYWMSLQQAQPTFSAVAHFPNATNTPALTKASGVSLARGGVVPIRVTVRRENGMNEGIEVFVSQLPSGVETNGLQLAPGQSEGDLILVASENAPSWTGPIELLARTTTNPTPIPVHAEAIAIDASPERGEPISRLSSSLWLSVSNLDVAPVAIRLGKKERIDVTQGDKVEIPVQAVRNEGGKSKCQLRPQNLPPKATAAEIGLEPAIVEANASLQIHAETPPGDYTFWLLNETKVKVSKNPQRNRFLEARKNETSALIASNSLRSEDVKKLQDYLVVLGKEIEQAKTEEAEKEYTVQWPSNSVSIRVLKK